MDDHAGDAPGIMTALQAAAAQAHELFISLQWSGFSEEQAMRIVIGVLSAPTDRTP